MKTPPTKPNNIDFLQDLLTSQSEDEWGESLFSIACRLGFEKLLLTLLPRGLPRLEDAYIKSNYPVAWRKTYDRNKLAYVDPTVVHCVRHTTAIFWTPELFAGAQQQHLYEEASSYGLKTGVSLPIHGPGSELGILSLATNRNPDDATLRDIRNVLPELSLLRDIVFESGIRYATGPLPVAAPPALTARELECLKWTAAGKSTWEISRILNCSESAVNFHIANFREKLNAPTRRDAVVKAIRAGILSIAL